MKIFYRMKSICCLCLLTLLLLASFNAPAQSGKLPPFSMMQSSGKIFRAQNLPLGKPIIIIYFDPDCDHCEKMMKELLNNVAAFKKASIAMVTYLPVEKVKQFENKYELKKHKNFYVGTEGNTFFLKNYYKLTKMPFLALYTKNGDFVKEYRTEVAIPDLGIKLGQL